EVYAREKDLKKCKELLLPRQARLGTSEGARILGQALAAEGSFDAAYPLLDAYARERLPALRKAETDLRSLAKAFEDEVIEELRTEKAPDFDFAAFKRAAKERQQALVSEYFQKRMRGNAALARAQADLARHARVVDVGFDLGIVLLRRGQALADPAARR